METRVNESRQAQDLKKLWVEVLKARADQLDFLRRKKAWEASGGKATPAQKEKIQAAEARHRNTLGVCHTVYEKAYEKLRKPGLDYFEQDPRPKDQKEAEKRTIYRLARMVVRRIQEGLDLPENGTDVWGFEFHCDGEKFSLQSLLCYEVKLEVKLRL